MKGMKRDDGRKGQMLDQGRGLRDLNGATLRQDFKKEGRVLRDSGEFSGETNTGGPVTLQEASARQDREGAGATADTTGGAWEHRDYPSV